MVDSESLSTIEDEGRRPTVDRCPECVFEYVKRMTGREVSPAEREEIQQTILFGSDIHINDESAGAK